VPRDFEAVLWLLARGGDLAAVRRWATRPLNARHLEILHRMMQRLEVHRVRGHRVGIVELDLGGYVEELAPLVSRCLEVFELPVLFALFGEGDQNDRVTLIARGDLPGFDLGQALDEMAGGGGHATAAAARIRGKTLLEAREELLEFLRHALPPAARARDLLIVSFFEVPAGISVADAKSQLIAWRVNAAPVVEAPGGRVVGIVTRQILDAAIQHVMGGRPVDTVMTHELEWVDPDAPADEVGERMLTRHPRFVLVGDPGDRERGRPLGLITRMQLLRHLHGRLESFEERLDRRTEQYRERRDMIAKLLARAVEGRVREHRAFLTAVVIDSEGFHIDVATARSEFYRAPAALPEVQMSALRQDLFRRDFSINTLAIRLGPDETPELIDYFGARNDLKEKTLRVLHSLSFIDDPTRVLRAVRLELRLGFRISAETRRLVEVALTEGIFGHLSGARLREELQKLLNDPSLALQGLERLNELGVLRVLQPGLELGEEVRERLRAARAAHDWYELEGLSDPSVRPWRLLLMALALDFEPAELERLTERLMLAGEDRRLLVSFPDRLAHAREALEGPDLLPHRAVEVLEPLCGEELLLLLAVEDEETRAWVRRYMTDLRRFELKIRGADLVAAGVPPGPQIGRLLEATRRARLDGVVGEEKEMELAFALGAVSLHP
jgi:tRNA nucleotidyltransferase (CCA-adding enzyme)